MKVVGYTPELLTALQRHSTNLQSQFSRLANNALKFYGGDVSKGSVGSMPSYIAEGFGKKARFYDPAGTDASGLRRLFDRFVPRRAKLVSKVGPDGFPDMSDASTRFGVNLVDTIQSHIDNAFESGNYNRVRFEDLLPKPTPYSDPWRSYERNT